MTRPTPGTLRTCDNDLGHDEPGAAPNAAPVGRNVAIEPLAVDAAQAAALIGVSRSMFHKLVSAGRIGPAGVRLGKYVRYPLAELRAWAEAGMPPRHEWHAEKGLK